MSEVNMEMAKNVYATVCSTLDNMGFKYKRHDEDLVVTFGLRGEDMNHDLIFIISAEKEAIQLVEQLPYSINSEKAVDVAIATSYVNRQLLCGKFTYDMGDNIRFEVTQIYSGSLIGEETIKRMVLALAVSVEEYDDKFMALCKGYIKPDAFKD